MQISFQHQAIETDDFDQLQDSLDVLGEQGFQLHTIQVVPIMGAQGVSSIRYFAVLTAHIGIEDEDDPDEEKQEGDHSSENSNVLPMAMK